NGVMPLGFKIQDGVIVGTASDATQPGTYYFRILVTDPSGYEVGENFYIIITAGISAQNPIQNNTIIWETPAGSIGHIYETQPSHCHVVARATGNAAPIPGDAEPATILGSGITPGVYARDILEPGQTVSLQVDSLPPIVFEFYD